MNDYGNEDGEDRRTVRHHGKHHKTGPSPNLWPNAGAVSGATDGRPVGSAVVGHHHHRHDVMIATTDGNGTARTPAPHVLQHVQPVSMCYTTNEVLVIIAVTCFLNFAFILIIMTCVHCFTDPSHHKKFGAVAYAELVGDELFDNDMIDGDTVTLLNPTMSRDDYYSCEMNVGDLDEFDLESCGAHRIPRMHDRPRYKSRRRSGDDFFVRE